MALPSALSGPWNPFRVTGTPMPPNLLLVCKILAVCILATGHVGILPDPFLPFVDGLDELTDPVTFRLSLQTVCVSAAVALLFNRCVRGSALVLGSCLLLAVLSSKAYYGNNKTFVGLALVLAGLSDFDQPPYLLRWQLALVYFGAALNKLLDPDWQSGLFFEHWAGEKLQDPVFLAAAERLPHLVAAKVMSWGTILAEFAVALGLLRPRLVPVALWVNILFQVALLELTGTTFTLFFYGMTAATLAFVTWPDRLVVRYGGNRGSVLRRLAFQTLDPDRLQDWQPLPSRRVNGSAGGCFQVVDRGRVYSGLAAVQRLLLFSPVFWLAGTALLAFTPNALSRRLLVAGVVLFFLPWFRRRSCRLEDSPAGLQPD